MISAMINAPNYQIAIAEKTDPLKAGALGRGNGHWSGAPLAAEVVKHHPELEKLLATASGPADLTPYFHDWFDTHAGEIGQAKLRLEERLHREWLSIVALVESLTDKSEWDVQPVNFALTSIYPSTYWGGKYTIDLYYDTARFERDIVHELVHLRTESILGSVWAESQGLIGGQRGQFIELLAEILLLRSTDDLAQAARSPYPFFAEYSDFIRSMSGEPDVHVVATATARAILGRD